MDLTAALNTPEHASAAALNNDGTFLAVGSDDGSVRFYQPPEPRVRRAIRGLGDSAADVLLLADDGNDCVVASGKSLFRFTFDVAEPKLIYSRADASFVLDVGVDDEDTINKLALSANGAHLACSTDAGGVHVLELATGTLSTMKTKHKSIAWDVAFIPDRPSELLSGGYDCALLLFDFRLGTLLAQIELSPAPAPAAGLASAPPFVTALAVSPRGALAAGCADGRVWIGLGGEKAPGGGAGMSKKRSRKWAGLSEEDAFFTKVDGGMIAALHFISPDELVSISVNGKLVRHVLARPQRTSSAARGDADVLGSHGGLRTVWTAQTTSCAKVDALACSDSRFAVAGLHVDQKRGAVELWNMQTS